MTPAGRRRGPTTSDAEILSAARGLFGRLGYRATTIRAVAEAAGVNQSLTVALALVDRRSTLSPQD